ncbi:glycosyltransferase family 4 protein [Pontimicrobium sp. MEBiC01747]
MKQLLYIGNKLAGSGKTVTTIDTLSKLLQGEGYVVKTSSSKNNKLLRLLDMLLSIFRNSKSTDYVLIDTYSTQNFYYAYLCSQLCRILKLKYIPILHGGNLPNRLKNNPKLSKQLFKNAHINVAPSDYTKSNFESLNYTNIICIPNAIEINKYEFKPKKINTIRLFWVRSFSNLYNPNLAISILHKLIQIGYKASLCMVGPDNDGALEKAKEHAKTLNVEVSFTNKLSKEEWIKLSEHYNVFINTTNFDNMPVSVIEAMALGLPVVSTNVGGLPFLINDSKNGVLVEPNNANAFVEAIIDLQDNKEKVMSIITEARKKVEQYDWQTVKLKWLSILK